MESNTESRFVEVEGGVKYLCLSRGEKPREYSFDNGLSWFSTMIEAYEHARKDGHLISEESYAKDSDSNEKISHWIASMIGLVSTLNDGERIIVSKLGEIVFVNKEETKITAEAGLFSEYLED